MTDNYSSGRHSHDSAQHHSSQERGHGREHEREEQLPENEGILQFDLSRFLFHFRSGVIRFWWMALIVIALCAGALLVNTLRTYRPVYQSDAILTVNVDVSTATNFYNTTTAKQMAATFPYILTSTQLVGVIQKDLGLSSLNASIGAFAVEKTNLFTIRVTSSDPQRAYDVLCSVLRNYPAIADYVIGETQLNLITEPQVPTAPNNPLKLQNSAAKGALIGLVICVALISLYAMLDLTVIGSHDIEQKFNGKCIAKVPYAGSLKKDEIAIDIRDKDLSPSFGEAFRSLRHEVEKKVKINDRKVVMITSTSSNEGKSTISVNLALSLAMHGSKVLLIDCDLRKPALKYHMKYDGDTPGLEAVLTRKVSFRDAVRVIQGTGLHVLFSSSAAENATDLCGSPVMDAFLHSLRDVYDYIILDTAPVALVADTGALAQYADGLIYVTRQDYVFASHVRDAVRQLSASGIEMFGFVLNITRKGGLTGRYGYGYGHGYGYGYGSYGRYGRYSSYAKHTQSIQAEGAGDEFREDDAEDLPDGLPDDFPDEIPDEIPDGVTDNDEEE